MLRKYSPGRLNNLSEIIQLANGQRLHYNPDHYHTQTPKCIYSSNLTISHTNLTTLPSCLKFPMESAHLDIFSKINPSFAYQNRYNLIHSNFFLTVTKHTDLPLFRIYFILNKYHSIPSFTLHVLSQLIL